MKKAMVDTNESKLSIRRQCELLDVNRNRLKTKSHRPWEPSPEETQILELMKGIPQKIPLLVRGSSSESSNAMIINYRAGRSAK